MGLQFPTFISTTILLQFFFIFFFHFFHNFLLLFIIMFAKIALIVGLMICASINTEAKRRLPAPVSLNEKYLIRIIDWKFDRIPKTIAILKKRYPEYDGSWEEVEAEIRAEYNSLKKKETNHHAPTAGSHPRNEKKSGQSFLCISPR